MILQEIAAKTRIRVEGLKKKMPLEEVKKAAKSCEIDSSFPFYQALAQKGLTYICEVKKASPSKGIIAEEFLYLTIAKEYQEAGAGAISCLTEPYYFKGADEYLSRIAEQCQIPVLRKDFIVDEYQIYEAKILGAAAILLICAILDQKTLKRYIQIAKELGMDALVEVHDEKEVTDALSAGADIIGVNNRDLKTFTVDIKNSIRLRHLIPKGVLFVSESGMKTPEDIRVLKENGTDAVLIGETLMRSKEKKKTLKILDGKMDDED